MPDTPVAESVPIRATGSARVEVTGPQAPDSDSGWRTHLLDLATRQLLTARTPSFNTLVSQMAGADPILVRSLLTDLAQAESPQLRTRAQAVIRDGAAPATASSPAVYDPELPIPHPLDFEWRFAPPTRAHLLRWALAGTPRSILLLGCPTLALALLSHCPEVHVTLADDNPALPLLSDLRDHHEAGYTQLRADLVANPEVTAGVNADVVIADAPFYPDAMAGFLHAAVVGSRHRAQLMFALPPFGTRPTAASDVRTFRQRAAASGLRHVMTTNGAARYLTPPFEDKAFTSAGLHAVARDWRAADLAMFVRADATDRPTLPTISSATSDRNQWHEVIVNGKRWRVKSDNTRSGIVEGLLVNAAIGSVLDSVSRRDARRHSANVCTEDNEFYVTANPPLFIQILHAVAAGLDPVTMAEQYVGRVLFTTEYTEVALLHDLVRRTSATAADGS